MHQKRQLFLQNTHFHTKDILQNHLIAPPSAYYNGKWDQLVGLEIFVSMGKKSKDTSITTTGPLNGKGL